MKGWISREYKSVQWMRRKRHTEESKLKFMCCKILKRLTVILPGEYSNKPSVKFRTHKLFVALPGNTRKYL
jgi:hypothetical protein